MTTTVLDKAPKSGRKPTAAEMHVADLENAKVRKVPLAKAAAGTVVKAKGAPKAKALEKAGEAYVEALAKDIAADVAAEAKAAPGEAPAAKAAPEATVAPAAEKPAVASPETPEATTKPAKAPKVAKAKGAAKAKAEKPAKVRKPSPISTMRRLLAESSELTLAPDVLAKALEESGFPGVPMNTVRATLAGWVGDLRALRDADRLK